MTRRRQPLRSFYLHPVSLRRFLVLRDDLLLNHMELVAAGYRLPRTARPYVDAKGSVRLRLRWTKRDPELRTVYTWDLALGSIEQLLAHGERVRRRRR